MINEKIFAEIAEMYGLTFSDCEENEIGIYANGTKVDIDKLFSELFVDDLCYEFSLCDEKLDLPIHNKNMVYSVSPMRHMAFAA